MRADFTYKAKAMFAFEEIDGVDVCFFGMHVQEYDSNCPSPNNRLVIMSSCTSCSLETQNWTYLLDFKEINCMQLSEILSYSQIWYCNL